MHHKIQQSSAVEAWMLRNKTAVVEDIDREILRAVEDQTRRNEDRYRAERQELENIQANLNNRE